MQERRKAKRYDVYLPLQVCVPGAPPAEPYSGQLRDISRSGVYFHSPISVEPGTRLELTFALPTDRERGSSAVVRASAKALRIDPIEGELSPVYGVAATIDRIDFVRPLMAVSAVHAA